MDDFERIQNIAALIGEHFADYHLVVKTRDGSSITKITDMSWSYGAVTRWAKDVDNLDEMNLEDRMNSEDCDSR